MLHFLHMTGRFIEYNPVSLNLINPPGPYKVEGLRRLSKNWFGRAKLHGARNVIHAILIYISARI